MSPPGVLAYNKSLYREMSFDPDRDLESVSLFALLPNVLVVHPAVPAQSAKELIAYAKANPGKLNYGFGRRRVHLARRHRAVQNRWRR